MLRRLVIEFAPQATAGLRVGGVGGRLHVAGRGRRAGARPVFGRRLRRMSAGRLLRADNGGSCRSGL
ncbi:hypothetical protein [Streptomyces sp. NPDC002785]|uniref:hypothetical protein n=1 Tax=Streptomyces sp. NPDC002785 TaxID=3154543 RepID=UPI00331A2FF3